MLTGLRLYSEDTEEARLVATLMDTGAGRELGSEGMDQFADLKTYGIA